MDVEGLGYFSLKAKSRKIRIYLCLLLLVVACCCLLSLVVACCGSLSLVVACCCLLLLLFSSFVCLSFCLIIRLSI